jgi:Holliday junction resolvase
MNCGAKGRRNEWRSRRLLEAAGYQVTRAAGSLGSWDLVAISTTDVVLVQVKSNRPPSPAEREALAGFAGPPNCKRLIHVWRDRERLPRVTELKGEPS